MMLIHDMQFSAKVMKRYLDIIPIVHKEERGNRFARNPPWWLCPVKFKP